ncbi:S41 family peptidase [Peribacillus alkalitolerans]|uniref:S41 family peptidase n=1 Tax=Peribacillus alkalitolerans TaxID=1550385 RepID=UPI0013D307EF|nr:S41 family peptidase [Peribacillus alkalitolerans]
MRHIRFQLAILLSFILFLLPSTSFAAEPINEVRELIKEYYYKEVPSSVLNEKTIKDITDQLDPYTVYMTKEEYGRFVSSIEGELVGIGVTLEEHEKGIQIMSVLTGGSAEENGLSAGDIITSAAGQSLVGESIQTAISLITGDKGTTVTLQILRPSNGSTFEKTLTRKIISLPNVEKRLLGGNIGYVKLNSYSLDAAEEVKAAISSMPGVKGWIFDLRDNPGGYVSAAQDVIGLFPQATKAFTLSYKGNESYTYEPTSQAIQWNAPVSLLINESSASASEMTAVSVKDQKAARIYGRSSYGKGVMQSIFNLSDGSVFKMTTAEFFGPGGTAVQSKGVHPDVSTASGKELEISHRNMLRTGLLGYTKMNPLKFKPNKSFTIRLNSNIDWKSIKKEDVSLIELGGLEKEIKFKSISKKALQITPKQPLEAGKSYMLMIDPKMDDTNKKLLRQGAVMELSVE